MGDRAGLFGRDGGARFQKCLELCGCFTAEAGHGCYLFEGCRAQPLYGPKLFQQGRLALLADAGEMVRTFTILDPAWQAVQRVARMFGML